MVNNKRIFVGYASFECNYLSNKTYLLLFGTTKPDSASFEPGTHPIKTTKHPRPQPRPASRVPVRLGESTPKAALDHGLRPGLAHGLGEPAPAVGDGRGPDLPKLGRPAPEGPPAAVGAIDGLHGHLFRKGI